MPDLDLDAIEHRLEWALSDLGNWDRYRQGNYREAWGAEELLELVAEVRRLRAEVAGLQHTQTVNAARVIGPAGTPSATARGRGRSRAPRPGPAPRP